MNSDREPSRLPLRAGAMLLLAVAIVCVGLGWHSAVTSGHDPQKDLRAAQSAENTGSPTAAPAAPSSSTAAAGSTRLCVYNAGTISGLAGQVASRLRAKGYAAGPPRNLSTSSVTENTIFYTEDQKTEAQAVADAVGAKTSIETRPSSFTQCADGIPVIVVTR